VYVKKIKIDWSKAQQGKWAQKKNLDYSRVSAREKNYDTAG